MKHKKVLLLLIPLLALMFLVALLLVRNSQSAAGSVLDFERYKQDWGVMQGNKYVFRGQIDQQLSYLSEVGRVLTVKNLEGVGRVPVFVPASMTQNFEAGQRYQFRALVQGDVLVVETVEKF